MEPTYTDAYLMQTPEEEEEANAKFPILSNPRKVKNVLQYLEIPQSLLEHYGVPHITEDNYESLLPIVLAYLLECLGQSRYELLSAPMSGETLIALVRAYIFQGKSANPRDLYILATTYKLPFYLVLLVYLQCTQERLTQEEPQCLRIIRAQMTPPPVLAWFGLPVPPEVKLNQLHVKHASSTPSRFRFLYRAFNSQAHRELQVKNIAWLRASRRGLWLFNRCIWQYSVVAMCRVPGRPRCMFVVHPSQSGYLLELTGKKPAEMRLRVLQKIEFADTQPHATSRIASQSTSNQTFASKKNDTRMRGIQAVTMFRARKNDPRVVLVWMRRYPDPVTKTGRLQQSEYTVLRLPPAPAPMPASLEPEISVHEVPLQDLWMEYCVLGGVFDYGLHDNVMYGKTNTNVKEMEEGQRAVESRVSIGYGSYMQLATHASEKMPWVTAVFGTPSNYMMADNRGRLLQCTFNPTFHMYIEKQILGYKPIRGTCTGLVPITIDHETNSH